MNRNRKMAAILVVAAALVLGLIVAVAHSGSSTPTESSGNSPIAANDPTGLASKGLQKAGITDAPGISNSGQSNNDKGNTNADGSSSTGESTTTTTAPSGGGKPVFQRGFGQVANAGVLEPVTSSTTTPPKSDPGSGPGGCPRKKGLSCP